MRPIKQRSAEAGVPGVHYTVTGGGDDVVVLLHGFADNLTTWHRVIPPLAARHRVIAIDLPGFGRSTAAVALPLLAGYVDVVTAVLDAEQITGPVSLMGNSMGAAVSASFAARHPDRSARVVLIDMPGLRSVPRLWDLAFSRPSEFGLRTALRVMPRRTAQSGLGWAYGRIASTDPRRLDPSAREGFAGPYSRPDSVAAILPIGRALVAELRTAGLGAVVAGLAAPTLLVFGARDRLTPARVLRRFELPEHSNGPDRVDGVSGMVVLPGCAHCPQLDQPDTLLAEVGPFLRPGAGLAAIVAASNAVDTAALVPAEHDEASTARPA